jgi:hypothetical protein
MLTVALSVLDTPPGEAALEAVHVATFVVVISMVAVVVTDTIEWTGKVYEKSARMVPSSLSTREWFVREIPPVFMMV